MSNIFSESAMIAVTLISFCLTVVLVLWRPGGLNEAVPAAFGAVLVMMGGAVTLQDLGYIGTTVGGAAITIMATVVMAIVLESFGFFHWSAERLIERARGSGIRLFWYVNLLCFLMTLFLNNDGSILITTPILIIVLHQLKLSNRQKIPYLLSGALTATASSAPIGVSNIVNLIALKIVDMDLYEHTMMMFIPSALGLLFMVTLLFLIFYPHLPRYIPNSTDFRRSYRPQRVRNAVRADETDSASPPPPEQEDPQAAPKEHGGPAVYPPEHPLSLPHPSPEHPPRHPLHRPPPRPPHHPPHRPLHHPLQHRPRPDGPPHNGNKSGSPPAAADGQRKGQMRHATRKRPSAEKAADQIDTRMMVYMLLFVLFARISLFLASYLHIPIEWVAVGNSALLLGWRWIYLGKNPGDIVIKIPWHILIFAFGMYVTIYGLNKIGLIDQLVELFQPIVSGGLMNASLLMGGFLSLLSAIFNNHPALMVGTLTLTEMNLDPILMKIAYLASVIGSDIGALLLPIGTLASLLWMHILHQHKIKINWNEYVKVTFIVIPPTVLFTLICLGFWVSWLY